MSKATKRKHLLHETNVANDYFAPPSKGQTIVRILASRGNNLHEVEDANKQMYLVSMPTKFRKNIWVKRGDFVIVEPIKEGGKVKAEMVRVLAKEHIKYFNKIKLWPEGFETVFDRANFQRARSRSTSSDTNSSSAVAAATSSSEWSTGTESECTSGVESTDVVTGGVQQPNRISNDSICLGNIKMAPDEGS